MGVLVQRCYIPASLFREPMTLLMKFSGVRVSLVPPAFGKKNLSHITRPPAQIPLLFIVHPQPLRRSSSRTRKVQLSIPSSREHRQSLRHRLIVHIQDSYLSGVRGGWVSGGGGVKNLLHQASQHEHELFRMTVVCFSDSSAILPRGPAPT